MNYEDMSDFEANKAVATHESLIVNKSQSTSKNPSAVMVNDIVQSFMFDPCNNPSDAWPIMIDNNIFITATREDHEFKYMTKCLINGSAGLGWAARFTEYSDNPLRAAMICFLKMKDAENAN